MNAVLNRSGLLVSCIESSRRSVSNHLMSSPRPGLVLTRSLPRGLPTASLRTIASFGLHLGEKVGHDIRPNRVRYPTDQQFTSSCSPPPLTRTQLLSVTKFKPNFDKDFHLANLTHLQAHSPFAPRKYRYFRGAKGDCLRQITRNPPAARERLRITIAGATHENRPHPPASCLLH